MNCFNSNRYNSECHPIAWFAILWCSFNSNRYNSELKRLVWMTFGASFNSNRYNSEVIPLRDSKTFDVVSIPTGTIQSVIGVLFRHGVPTFQFQQVQFRAFIYLSLIYLTIVSIPTGTIQSNPSSVISQVKSGFNSNRYNSELKLEL